MHNLLKLVNRHVIILFTFGASIIDYLLIHFHVLSEIFGTSSKVRARQVNICSLTLLLRRDKYLFLLRYYFDEAWTLFFLWQL